MTITTSTTLIAPLMSTSWGTPTDLMSQWDAIDWLTQICVDYGVLVVQEDLGEQAGGYSHSKKVLRLDINLTPEEQVKTMTHEIIHMFQKHDKLFMVQIGEGDNMSLSGVEPCSLSFREWAGYIKKLYGPLYGTNFSRLWHYEVGAHFLQNSYYSFKKWYEEYKELN